MEAPGPCISELVPALTQSVLIHLSTYFIPNMATSTGKEHQDFKNNTTKNLRTCRAAQNCSNPEGTVYICIYIWHVLYMYPIYSYPAYSTLCYILSM